MLLRLKMYRLLLKFTTYLLPFLAFEIGWQVWALSLTFIDRPVEYSHQGHFTLVLFSAFVWAIMSSHFNVTNVDELFRERTGAIAACKAPTTTPALFPSPLFFVPNIIFPLVLFFTPIT